MPSALVNPVPTFVACVFEQQQAAVHGINHIVSKEVARGLKETASAVVKESVSSQLGAMVKKMLVEGDMTTQIQASITQSMASMIAGVMERLKVGGASGREMGAGWDAGQGVKGPLWPARMCGVKDTIQAPYRSWLLCRRGRNHEDTGALCPPMFR